MDARTSQKVKPEVREPDLTSSVLCQIPVRAVARLPSVSATPSADWVSSARCRAALRKGAADGAEPPVATAACVHLSAVLGNFLNLEYGYAGVPWRDELVAGSEIVADGHIPLPTAPGLGIEWDGEAARRHAVKN